MILSFGSKETENIWQGTRVKKLPQVVQEVGRRKLRMLNNALDLKDLRIPPGNRLERLAGRLKAFYSIRINDQWRIIFKWIIMAKLKNIHPGEVLFEEFLIPFEISAYKLAKDIGIPQTRVSEILKGNRRITADTALRLSKYFGNSAKFWLGLQDDFDLEEERISKGSSINAIKSLTKNAA